MQTTFWNKQKMQDNHLYEYAIIRVVPRVEREEFINIGLILFCKHQKYLRIATHIHEDKIQLIAPEFDLEQLQKNLQALAIICKKPSYTGRIDDMDLAEKFRFIAAVKSSVLQTSRPHPGYAKELDQTFDRLFQEMVM